MPCANAKTLTGAFRVGMSGSGDQPTRRSTMPPSKEQRTTRQSRPRPGARMDAASCYWLVPSSYGLTRPGRLPTGRAILSWLSDHGEAGTEACGPRLCKCSAAGELCGMRSVSQFVAPESCQGSPAIQLYDNGGAVLRRSADGATHTALHEGSVSRMQKYLGSSGNRRGAGCSSTREIGGELRCDRGASDGSTTPGGPQRGATALSPCGAGADLERVTASTQLGQRAASFSCEVVR